MCGFAGLLDLSHATARSALEGQARDMAATLHHRGPDSAGTWGDAEAGIALAHQRLAIVDLSPGGHQPMISPSGRYVIAFNGEVYNFRSIQAELEPTGWRPRGTSDTEVMLAAFDAWGVEAALPRFVGMFAFALWDRAERTLHLVRDRLGVKPLYVARAGNKVLFGSELRALQAHAAFERAIDPEALVLFFRFGYVPAPYSIWRAARKVMPGTRVVVGVNGSTETHTYWSLNAAVTAAKRAPFQGTEAEALDQLELLLRDAVRLRLVADVPLGVLLSGGIDSTIVAALAQAESLRPVKSFTIGMPTRSHDEAPEARRVAAHLGLDHTEMTVTPEEALATVPTIAQAYDEPFADSSQVPTYIVSKLARQKVTVCLSGDGGDELFGGYNRHLWANRAEQMAFALPAGLRRWTGRALASMPARFFDRGLALVAAALPSALRIRNPGERINKLGHAFSGEPGELYRSVISHWQRPGALVDVAEPATLIDRAAEWPPLANAAERIMYLDTLTYLPDDILTKVDRASMAVSLEAREPLLDHRLVEFAWRLPMQMKIRGGQGKWALRQVLHRLVPRELVDRPKWGFAIPMQEWLRGPLRPWAEELLDERALAADGLLNPGPVRALWKRYLAGQTDNYGPVWTVLMYQAWRQQQA